MEGKFVISVLETPHRQLQECEIKVECSIWKIRDDLYLTVMTPPRIILLILLLNVLLKTLQLLYKLDITDARFARAI